MVYTIHIHLGGEGERVVRWVCAAGAAVVAAL